MENLANPELVKTVILLATSVTIVPIFKRLGVGTVLGYLVAGCLIGPSGFGLFQDPAAIVHMAELGVVMFLFMIGLEMYPQRLWSLRKDIFGRGLLQVVFCGVLLTLAGIYLLDLPRPVAFIAGMGFTLSSTAIIMQILTERSVNSTPKGQRIVSTLLFEDLAIVPLLAIVSFLSPTPSGTGSQLNLMGIGISLAAVILLVVIGKWVMNPLFRFLSRIKVREMMTAAALLVVLGAALLMEVSGLSMAMGAFVAGVMLSESSFRHQLEADIEPFRGLLLGLFFMGVGMSLDIALVLDSWSFLLAIVLIYVCGKMLSVYLVALVSRLTQKEALFRTKVMANGGEFAFVLFSAAGLAGVITAQQQSTFTAAIIVSMILSPLVMMLFRAVQQKFSRQEEAMPTDTFDGIEMAEDLHNRILIIGFGRFNQVICQTLLARGISVSVIDNNTDHIRAAAKFGFKVYYGNGEELEVLRACGIENVQCVIVGVNNTATSISIVKKIKQTFPLITVLARTYDRNSSVELVKAGVDFKVRETYESALALGKKAFEVLGVDDIEADAIIDHIRRLDQELMNEQLLHNDISDETLKRYWTPIPWLKPQTEPEGLNPETAAIIADVDVELSEDHK